MDGEVARGRIALEGGQQALLALTAADGEPLLLPGRDDAERRLDDTVAFWERWSRASRADGPWRHAVLRSGLVLKLLVHAPTGSIAGAGTTSLPEELGGVRNWDYRFTWVRDAAFSLDALLRLGHRREAHAFFWWLMHASQLRHPDLRPLYRLDGGRGGRERDLAFEGYRGSRPVRSGNEALEQLQLDVYGSLLEAVAVFVEAGGQVDPDTGGRMAETADRVCELWRRPDAGIWEVRSAPRHFTHSKVMCWVALDRALRLAQDVVPGYHAGRWRTERAAIERFIERHCWSAERGGYVRHPETEELDASLLMAAFLGYPNRERTAATVDAVRRELSDGPFVYRYRGDDGLPGREGAFLACSFWLVNALATVGRVDEAAATMDELLAHANDVGLFAEEFAPDAGRQLGNFPQALTHLALINAAASVGQAVAERQGRRFT